MRVIGRANATVCRRHVQADEFAQGTVFMTFEMRAALAAIVVAIPGPVAGADLPQSQPAPAVAPAGEASAAQDWVITIGGAANMMPAWPGANKYVLWGSPSFSARKDNGTPPRFVGARDGAGFAVVNFGEFKFGPALKFVRARKASDDTQLSGLPDVDFAVQAGGFAEFWPVTWLRLRGDVRQGFGGETGVTGDAFLDAVVPFGPFRISGGPRVTAQSTKAVSPYFSITPAASPGTAIAGLPQLPVYNASGGLYSYGAGSKLEYFINQHWTAFAFGEFERLTGSVADSPLVTMRGSPNQVSAGVGATYSFTMHPLW
jgi:MipA family protein